MGLFNGQQRVSDVGEHCFTKTWSFPHDWQGIHFTLSILCADQKPAGHDWHCVSEFQPHALKEMIVIIIRNYLSEDCQNWILLCNWENKSNGIILVKYRSKTKLLKLFAESSLIN